MSDLGNDGPEELFPNDCETLCALGFSSLLAGDTVRARKFFQHSLALDPDYVFGYLGLAKSRLPGAGYIEIIKRIIAFLEPQRYVEIGVERGAVLGLFAPSTRVVGIDPEPRVGAGEILENTSIYPQTSDDFFAENDLQSLLRGPFDLAFIDGLHTFEQALKDFINLESCATSTSVILIHDTLPLDRQTSTSKRKTVFWTGDVWKIIPCLKQERPDLRVFTIPTYPAGLSVVAGLQPSSRVLAENLPSLMQHYQELDLEEIASRQEFFSLVDNNWSKIKNALIQVLEKES